MSEPTTPSATVTTETEHTVKRRKHDSERKRAERRLGLMLVAPAALVMIAVTGYPIIYAVWLSLQRSDLRFPEETEFVGLGNYITVLSSSLWWADLGRTLFITVVSVAIELVLGMLLALVMHRALVGRGLVRTSSLIPYGIVTVVAAFAWRLAFSSADGGFVPALFNWETDPLTETWPTIGIAIMAEVWKTTPFMALLLLAGLSLVPDELHEAARVDGASAWQRFWRITIPLMKIPILVALLFRTLDAFRIFDSIYILSNTGQNRDVETVSILGYNQLLNQLNLGLGSAISVLIFICVALIAVLFIRVLGTSRPGEA
ncbi:MAG: trehalose/maltose transport system permease protein [Chloroflexota bacterium]|nr:trehalose/maltose transport system permease protein [Chloroflexota bacterium]